MYDATVRTSIVINSPIDRVFDFLVSPAKIPLVLPGLVENYDIPPLPLAPGSTFHFRYQMYGVMLQGTWKVTRVERPKRYEASTTGEVASEWKYELTTQGNDSTNVNVVVTYETPRTVLQKIKSDVMLKINQQEAEHFLKNMKTVLEMQPV